MLHELFINVCTYSTLIINPFTFVTHCMPKHPKLEDQTPENRCLDTQRLIQKSGHPRKGV